VTAVRTVAVLQNDLRAADRERDLIVFPGEFRMVVLNLGSPTFMVTENAGAFIVFDVDSSQLGYSIPEANWSVVLA